VNSCVRRWEFWVRLVSRAWSGTGDLVAARCIPSALASRYDVIPEALTFVKPLSSIEPISDSFMAQVRHGKPHIVREQKCYLLERKNNATITSASGFRSIDIICESFETVKESECSHHGSKPYLDHQEGGILDIKLRPDERESD